MKPATNLSLLWPELPYEDRFAAAAAAGFKAVEVLFPYGPDTEITKAALIEFGLEMILINAPSPLSEPRGFAAQPDAVAAFRADIQAACECATFLGASFIHVMTGEAAGEVAKATLVDNLHWAADVAPPGITLTLEPLNPVSMPGYFLNDYGLAADILAAVERPNVALQYDSFHAQMIHGNAAQVYETYNDLIAHVQIGDAPNRNAPGAGQVDFASLFAVIRAANYGGWISGEYHPGRPTKETLDWMTAL